MWTFKDQKETLRTRSRKQIRAWPKDSVYRNNREKDENRNRIKNKDYIYYLENTGMKEKTRIKNENKIGFILLFLFVIFFMGLNMNMKAEAATSASTTITGTEFNAAIKKLAGNNNASYYSEDKKINQIVNAEDIDADKISEVENSSKVSFGDVDIYYYESSDNGNQIVVDGKINLTDGAWTFAYLEALQKVDMSLFNTAEVTNMNRMFNNCPSLQNIDLNSLDTSKATDMNYMFYNCAFLTELDVTKFDTSNVTDMSGMFSNCSSLATLNVGNFNTAKTTNMNRIFDNCAKLNSIDVSGFDTSKVTDMGYMFYNCSLVTKLDVNDFNTENVTDMSGMFSNCLNLASLNVTGFNTANVINMNRMFNNCQNLKELDVTNFDTSNVTDFADIFCNCLLIKSLDISNFNTSNATDLSEMFLSCVKLTSLKVNSFDLANVKKLNNMLYNCPSLSANIIFVSMPAETPSYSDIFRGTANNGKAKITVEFDDNNEELVRAFVKEKNDEDNVILKVDDVIIYPIDYNLNGGTWEENHEGPKTYHEKMSDFTIPTPQKSGYTFRGWVTPDSERPTTEYVVKTGTKGRIELSACWYPDKEISVTYNANGGEFSKGQAENTVKWAWKSVSVTDSENESSNNLDKNGNGGLGYDNNLNELKKLTIDGAETITVNVMYQTEADNDWVAIFEPEYDKNDSSVEILPSDDKANDSLSGKLSGGDSIQTVSYTINGDTAYVLFHTNESDNNYYGYHVTVTGTHSVEKYILTEGTKEEPTNTQKVFDGWYIDKECTKSFTEDHDLNEDCTVYAGWKDETTILIPGADFKNIVNAITENDLSNVKSIQRAEDLPEDDDNVVTISTEDSSHSIYMWFDKANGILHWESDAEDENIFFNENSANMFADLSLLETNDLMNVKTDKIKIADSMFANCNKLTGTITLGSIESYTDMFRGASIEEPYKVSVYYRDNTYDDVVAEVAQKNSEDRVEIVGTEYRIEYILNNGTLTTENSKSVKSDSPDFILNNPTRTGYTFTGWTGSNGTTPELTVTIHPAAMQDRTYTANWTPNNDTTYYVMHWKQKLNGIASAKDSINYELAETESLVGETGATITPDVKSYDGFTAPDVTSDIIMASGSTIVNYYYTRNYYTITFNESNGIESSSGSGRYLYEENVTLSAKVKDNYQITGWSASSGTTITSTGNDSGVTLTMPAKNITVTISSSPIEYKITYDLDGGTSLNPTKYNIESDDITLTAPTKEGYEFLGWSGTDLAEPSLEVTIPKGSTGDREYQATWKNLGYHIVYNLDGGTLENKVSYYKITSDDIEVGAPTKTGYTFNGWKNEKTGEITEKILIPTGSTGDREYTALWLINTYQQILNVRYENVDGTFTDYEEIANEVKDYGSTFEWKRDADSEFETGYMSYTVEESRTEDITIYRKKYNLTIDAALDGNYFTNLDSMGTVSVFVNGETVLDDKNGGAISVRSGSTYEVYNIKTNDGYTYNGITKGTQLGIVSANTTVRLSYSIIPYTISYDLNGGSGATGNPKGYTVKSEDIKLEEPTRENYDFIGWSLSSDPAVKETIIKKGSTGDRKYVAKWTAKEFKITYNLDGGTLHGEQNTFTMDSPTFELNTPSKAGYTFLGWTGSNGDTPERLVMIENGSVGDKTYTANWERNANTGYTVNYWRQKLTGDATVKDDKNYTLYESQHFEGETDTEVYAPLKDFDGFETPDDKIVKIKGDGSSVVDYYFVRESFIVTVDTAGNGNIEITMGSDIPKVGNNTFLYGTKVSVTASSKDGVYNWKGWTGTFATSAEKITFSMPAKDVHLTATANEFTPQTYLIKYNLDGGAFQTSIPTSYQDFDNIQIPNPTKEGYEFLGWVGSNGQIPQKDIEITGEMKGDLEYTALWMTSKDIHDIALGLTDIKVRASATDEVTFYPDIEEDGNTTDYVIKWLESDDDGQTWSLIREIAAKHASVDVAKEILGYKMNANCSQSFKQYKYYISNEAGTIQSGKISLYVSEKYHFDEDNKILYIETTGHSDDDLNTYPMNDYSDPRWEQLGEDVIPWKDEKEKAEKIIVNDNISTIGSLAFKDCINLKHVTLPESEALLSINQSAFENTGLLGIILPESVQTVKSNAFKDCNNLRDIYFLNNATIISETEGTIPDSSDVDIKGYDRDTDKYERKHGYPVSEKDIPWRCVKDYIQYVDIERNVIGISANSFTGLYNLKEVYNRGFDQIIGGEIFDVIKRRKTTIGADAIEIEVTEPVNVERIAGRLAAVGFDTITISDLQGLTLVPGKHYIYPNMIKEEVIEELQNDVKYIVPVYVNLDENKEFVDAVPQPEEKGYRLESLCIASGICGDNLRWYVYRDGYMEIKGTGEMYDYAEDGDNVAPWYQYKDKFRTVILPDGITRIGSYAFQGLENVKQMTLTGNIESIGVGAWNNSSITTINFPSNLTSIEGAIFVGANDLTEITGSNAHYHTVDGVLYSRDNKVLVEFMKDQLINPETGRNYSDDHIFKIPDTVEEIAERAFYGIDSLNKIYMTGSVTNIKEKAFAQMPKLYFVDNNANELNVPASGSEAAKVQKVALNAFEGSATKFTSREVLIYRSNTEFATAATAAGYKVRYYDDLTIDHINAHYDGEDIVLGNKVPMSKVVFDIVFTSGLSETTTGDDVRITLNGNGVITKLGENKFNATYNDGYTSTIQTGTFTVNGINKIVAMAAKYNGLDVWYGEKFVPSDVIVTLEYSNGELKTTTGENKAVSFNKEIIQVLDKDSHYGTENVIVKYDDGQNAAFSSEIQIGCSDYLETISATYNGTQTVESTAGISGLTDAIKQNIKISLKWKGNTSVEAIDGADGAVHYSGGSTMVENKLQFVIDYDKLNRYSKTAIVNIPAASNIRDVSIRYTGTPTTVGTEINPANLTIIVYYNDGTQKSFKGDTVDNLTINPNIIKDSGTNIVAVTYNPPGFSKTENVAVQGTIALPVKLIIVERPKKTVYQEGELFDPDGLRVNCLYDNGDIRDVSNEITIENATEITPQTKNVIISYNETRDGNNHIVKTYLSINVNQNQKVLTQDKSFRESYEIERILFRSKKTEDISGAGSANANDNLEDNTDEDDSDDDGKWSEIEITNDSRTQNTELAAAIKAGYGFELKVFTKYKTTRGNDEFKTFLQKSKWDTAYDTKYATVAEYINHKEDWEYLNDIYPQYVPTANPDLMYVKIIKRTADNGDKTTKIGNKDFIVMDKTDRDEKSQIIAEGPWYNSSKIFEFPLRTVNEDGDIVTTDDEVSGDRRVYVSKDAAESGKATTEYIVQVLSPAWYGYESEPKFDDATNQFIQNDPTSEENPGIVKNWYNGDPYKYLHVAYEFSLYVQKNDDVHTHILQ